MYRSNYFWENSAYSSSSSEDEESLQIERREYKMFQRIQLNTWDDRDFLHRFRLSKRTTMMVLEEIKDSLPCDERRSRELRPITQLLIALRYYALGSFQLAIADFSGVCVTSVHVVLKRVSRALAELSPRYIHMPQTQNERLKAAKEFFAVAKFPRTIGAIDCTHIRIQSPGGTDAENFRNRKGWFSLNVQTVSAANLKINDIVARWQGSAHDQRIFNMSSLKKRFEDGEFEHFILVGDSGYTNTTFLATPFLNVRNAVENLYNESQIRTRNCVERSYGVWKRRFPVLATGLRCSLDTVQSVIVACAVLHNIAIDQNEPQPSPEMCDFANMLAATDVPSDTLLGPASATTHNVRARLVRSYFQPMLDS